MLSLRWLVLANNTSSARRADPPRAHLVNLHHQQDDEYAYGLCNKVHSDPAMHWTPASDAGRCWHCERALVKLSRSEEVTVLGV